MSSSYSGNASNFDFSTQYGVTQPADGEDITAASEGAEHQKHTDAIEAIRQRMQGVSAFGDGSDGAATFDGSSAVTGWSRSGSTYTALRHTHFTNATVSTGVTLNPSGFGMWVNGTLTLTGTAKIDASGANAVGQVAGAVPASGIWRGTAGSNGGNATTNGSNVSASNVVGGAGGAGGISDSGNTPGTVTSTAPNAEAGSLRAPPSFESGMLYGNGGVTVPVASCGGSGGGGGNSTKGGGGGAGGGWIHIRARIISCSASCDIWAKGGNGGNGEVSGGFMAGGGGGGGGGVVNLGYNLSTGAATPSSRVSVAGGAAGTGLGSPAAGASGLALVRVI